MLDTGLEGVGGIFCMGRQRSGRRGLEREGLEGEGAVMVFEGVEGCSASGGVRLLGLRGARVARWEWIGCVRRWDIWLSDMFLAVSAHITSTKHSILGHPLNAAVRTECGALCSLFGEISIGFLGLPLEFLAETTKIRSVTV